MTLRVLLAFSCIAMTSLSVVSLSSGSKHTSKTASAATARPVETHHPQGWRFTMPKGDPAKGRPYLKSSSATTAIRFAASSFRIPRKRARAESNGLDASGGIFRRSIMNPNAVVPKTYQEVGR